MFTSNRSYIFLTIQKLVKKIFQKKVIPAWVFCFVFCPLAFKLWNYAFDMSLVSLPEQIDRQEHVGIRRQLEIEKHTNKLNQTYNLGKLKTLNNFAKCPSVLDEMVYGSWNVKPMTNPQKADMDKFLQNSRALIGIPKSLQRNDTHCGNISFPQHLSPIMFLIRALCDPKGEAPCCYNNQCVEKSIEQCQCDNCFDMRQPIHAEYSDWIPYDRRCQIKIYNHLEACELLSGSTLAVIGDSYIRHIYTALLLVLRNNTFDGALRKNVSKEVHDLCTGMYMFTEKICRIHLEISKTSDVCDGKINFVYRYFSRTRFGDQFAPIVKDLVKKKSLLLFGIGVHDNFNSTSVQEKYVRPVMDMVKNKQWPKLLWANVHSPGILKNGNLKLQSKSLVLRYNREMESILSPQNIPIFNTYNMTDGTMSFDGSHYGLGMNMWKVQILLNYIQELKNNGKW